MASTPHLIFRMSHPFGEQPIMLYEVSLVVGDERSVLLTDIPLIPFIYRLNDWALDPSDRFEFSHEGERSTSHLVLDVRDDRMTIESTTARCGLGDSFTSESFLEAIGTFMHQVSMAAELRGITLFDDPSRRGFVLAPIPKALFTHAAGTPFVQCLDCGKDLRRTDADYLIQKSFRQYPGRSVYDVIYDFAICIDCVRRLHDSFSLESRTRIQNYFQALEPTRSRFNRMIRKHGTDFDRWTARCFVKGTPKEELDEYEVSALCLSGNLVFMGQYPMMLSNLASDELHSLLSNKTLDELDNFYGTHLGIPPEFRVLFNPVMV